MDKINNDESEGFDDSAVAIGDLTYKQLGVFMSIYVSALRSLGGVVQKEGPVAGLTASYRMLAQNMMLLDPTIVGIEQANANKDKIAITTMAIGHAMASAMSYTDPVQVGQVCNTALECVGELAKDNKHSLGTTHLVFSCSLDGGSVKVSVSGISTKDLAELSSISKDTVSTEGIIKLGEKPKKD